MTTPQADEQEATGAAGSNILSRHPAAIALGGGVAAAFGSSFIPMNAIEGFVTAYGIAELLPAAAPPLGDTARLALSAGIGTLTAGALLALLPRAESDDMGFETAIRKADDAGKDTGQPVAPAAKSGKLAGWLRTLRFGKADAAPGTITDFSDLAAPRIRNGDQHPDAPVRAPIRASADLGAPLVEPEAAPADPLELGESMAMTPPVVMPPMAGPEPVQPVPAPSLRFAPPPLVEPLIEPEEAEEVDAISAPIAEPEPAPYIPAMLATDTDEPVAVEEPTLAVAPEQPELSAPAAIAPAPAIAEADAPLDDLDSLGVPELLARLEAGLARRRSQAQADRGAPPAADTGARLFSLAKPPVAEGSPSEASRPFRLRLGDVPRFQDESSAADLPSEAPVEAAPPDDEAESFRSKPLWDEEVDYLLPSVGTDSSVVPDAIAETPAEEPAPAPAAAEDDMDAALRDALATLRQLSDRQRSS